MNYYCEKQLAFINLECLFPVSQQSDPLSCRQEVPKDIHPLASRALDRLSSAGYREIIFYWPQPLTLFPQALHWLKQHGLREIWYGTAGQGETRPLWLLSSHFDHRRNGTWEHLHWTAAMIQQTLVDRQIVRQVFLLDPMAGHVTSYVGEIAPDLSSFEMRSAESVEKLFGDDVR